MKQVNPGVEKKKKRFKSVQKQKPLLICGKGAKSIWI